MFRSTWNHYFRKKISQSRLPKSSPITRIAINEKMKIKNIPQPYNFYFSLPLPFWFSLLIFKKLSPSYPFFGGIFDFLPPLQKIEGLETMCIHLKIYQIMFVSFCVFLFEHFYVFWMFYCCWLCSKWFSTETFPHFPNQMKQKAGSRFDPLNENNKLIETLETKQI